MKIKYDAEISNDAIAANLKRLTNQIYKLLPCREEGLNWKAPLQTIVEEVAGMANLISEQHQLLFPLLCKLEGLLALDEKEDFFEYRRTIFDCLNLISNLVRAICQD